MLRTQRDTIKNQGDQAERTDSRQPRTIANPGACRGTVDHIFANKEIARVQTVGRQGEAVDRSPRNATSGQTLSRMQKQQRFSSIFSTSTTTASSKIGRGARTRRWIRRMPTPAQLRKISRAARKFEGESWSYPTNMVRRYKRLESRFTVPLRRPPASAMAVAAPLDANAVNEVRCGKKRATRPLAARYSVKAQVH